MSLKYVVGNLLTAHEEGVEPIIAHQANCFNVMGSGIAKSISQKYPSASVADKNTVRGDPKKLGNFTMAFTKYGSIFNLYGQYNTGKNTDYDYLRNALRSMAIFLLGAKSFFTYASNGICVGLPKIGAGIGGGDWDKISKIIEEELCGQGIFVTIYVLKSNEIPLKINEDEFLS